MATKISIINKIYKSNNKLIAMKEE